MKLLDLTKRLRKAQPKLAEFGVATLHVFGSVARDKAKPGSDVDLLVNFASEPTFDRYMRLKFFLEDLLGCSVDLLTFPAIRPEIRPFIEEDARRVA